MHLNTEQILWALILAGHLILLVVLLGRDRAARYRWFTASIALSAVALIANHLLHGKLTTVAFYWQSYSVLALDSLLGLLVLIEVTRRVFSSGRAGLVLKAKGWIGWSLVTLAISAGAVWAWGPWPTMVALKSDRAQLPLLLTVIVAMKSQLFVCLLTVQVALLLRIFAKRFGFGWRSHPQQIALGLSTNALGFLVVQAITDIIKHTVHLTSQAEYNRVLRLFTNLENARTVLSIVVLVWWIYWLWKDDPAEPTHATAGIPVDVAGEPVAVLPGEVVTTGDEIDPNEMEFRD